MTEPLNLSAFDQSVRAQDDLYRFANGGWLRDAVIADDKASTGSFMDLRDDSEAAVRDIIVELDPGTADGDSGKIARLYASFMDEATIEELGASQLTEHLRRIDEISTPEQLAGWFGWCTRHGVRNLFQLGVDADPGEPQRYSVFFNQSGLGLPDEEYYRLENHAGLRQKYRQHVERMLDLVGAEEADEQARAVLDLETRIARHHWDKVRTRDLLAMYNPQSWQEFTDSSSALCWTSWQASAGIPDSAVAQLVNAQPTFFADVAQLLTDNTLNAWRSWARFCLVSSLAPYLSSDFVDERFSFYGNALQGVPTLRARWKRGVALVEGLLGEPVGQIYVEQHFPPEAKQRMDELVSNLLAAYQHSISQLDWMSDETREQALDKLTKFTPKIGYPDEWRDYSALTVSADDLIGNVLRGNSFDFEYELNKLTGPMNPHEWFMYPQTVNAYYHPLRNEIVFPAAILQPPFFNLEADDAVNYGGIGAVIGHEIGHGFDDQGSNCDGDGRLRNWWTDADREAFTDRTRTLIGQYEGLVPQQFDRDQNPPSVNGALTIGENIGDLGGLGIAYKAWRLAVGDDLPAQTDGFSAAQRLFLGFAAVWQNLMRDEAMRERLATDPHSPAEFRCNQIVKNVDAFHEAFDVQPGDELWMEPERRVSIW